MNLSKSVILKAFQDEVLSIYQIHDYIPIIFYIFLLLNHLDLLKNQNYNWLGNYKINFKKIFMLALRYRLDLITKFKLWVEYLEFVLDLGFQYF